MSEKGAKRDLVEALPTSFRISPSLCSSPPYLYIGKEGCVFMGSVPSWSEYQRTCLPEGENVLLM